MQQIAGFFCLEEATEIMSLPPSERERAFFRCWTRKEAYIKAIGDGLSAPLDGFRVTVLPNAPAHFVHLGRGTTDTGAWTLHDLCLAPDYAAALAYRDRQRPLSIFPIVDLAEFFSTL
jgi:4'-phosphopantetheinyl transferase